MTKIFNSADYEAKYIKENLTVEVCETAVVPGYESDNFHGNHFITQKVYEGKEYATNHEKFYEEVTHPMLDQLIEALNQTKSVEFDRPGIYALKPGDAPTFIQSVGSCEGVVINKTIQFCPLGIVRTSCPEHMDQLLNGGAWQDSIKCPEDCDFVPEEPGNLFPGYRVAYELFVRTNPRLKAK